MKRYLLYLILISLLVRIPLLIFVAVHPNIPYTSHDSFGYDAIARNLIKNGSFSIYPQDPQIKDPVRTPGYPLFLAAIYGIFPNTAFSVVFLQMVLDMVMVIMLFFFGRMLVHHLTGFIAALLYALHLHQIFFATQILTEVLFAFVLLAAVFGFLLFLRGGRIRMLCVAACCFGVAIMVRPIAILLPVIPLAFLIKRRVPVRSVIIFALIVIILPLLWIARNGLVFRQFFLTKIHSVNLILYHAPSTIAEIEQTTRDEGKELFFEAAKEKYGLTDYDIDYFDDSPDLTNTLAREARGIACAYPLLLLKHHFIGTAKVFLPLNVGFMADLLSGKGAGGAGFRPIFASVSRLMLRGRVGKALALVHAERIQKLNAGKLFLFLCMILYQLAIYLFAAVGIKKQSIPGVTLFLLLVIAYLLFIPGVVGEARFRVPIEPLFAFMAAIGIANMGARRRIGEAGNKRTGDEEKE